MKLKSIARLALTASLLAGASFSASAATILDGWQLVTPAGTVANIGRLNLSNGVATVLQEVNAEGRVFVGSKFVESGAIFSMGYTPEDTVGGGDGDPNVFPLDLKESLRLGFTNVTGHVIQLNADGGFKYVFDSGDFLLSGQTGGNYASGSIIGLGGTASSTNVIGGLNGDSTVLATVATILSQSFDLRDSNGVSFKPLLATGEVLFQAVTNNFSTGTPTFAACGFATAVPGDGCVQLRVVSGGDAYLVREVPEPGTLALAGFALFGLGMARRRRSAAK